MSGETILIVDDEESVRKSLADVMRDEDYEVVTASSDREGVDLLNETQPSLALLDIAMPEMDGVEVLRTFREMSPDMPSAPYSSLSLTSAPRECGVRLCGGS